MSKIDELLKEERITVLEIARLVLNDGNLMEWVGNNMDISDQALDELRWKINNAMSEEPIIDEDPNHHSDPRLDPWAAMEE